MRGPVTLDVERAQARLDALEARSAALAALAAKLREIERDERYKAVWELATLHGMPYAGPTCEKELLAAEAALGTAEDDSPERRRELALRHLEESDFRGSSERSIRANLPPEAIAVLEEHGASELFDAALRAYLAEAERFALALYIERLTVAELEALRAWSTSPIAGKLRELDVECAADLRELSRKYFGNLELEPKEASK